MTSTVVPMKARTAGATGSPTGIASASGDGRIGAVRGTALFVAAIVGPGILTLPALAAARAGPASLLALGLLLILSGPVAATFAALHRAVPHAHGVAGYAAAAFGAPAGRLVSAWFRYGVPVGIPALGLIGGQYVAQATGTGEATAVVVAAGSCALALVASLRGRAPGGILTLTLSALLIVLVLATAAVALPHARTESFTPVAPHGWTALAGSALVLTWVLTGWEAATNFTHTLRDPDRTLPRVTTATLLVVALLYGAVAIPEIAVLGPTAGDGPAPVAAMLDVAVGPAGAVIAALVAVVIATSNTVAWVASLVESGRGPGDPRPTTRAQIGALAAPGTIMVVSLASVAFTSVSTTHLISICAGAQVPVYVVGLAAGLRLLPARGRAWWLALVAAAAVSTLVLSAGWYLLAPALIAVVSEGTHHLRARRSTASDAAPTTSSTRRRS